MTEKKTAPMKTVITDEGMMADPPDPDAFDWSAYKSEAEAMAAWRARFSDAAYERMSSADGIVAVPPSRPKGEKPGVGSDMNLGTFPDLETAPGKQKLLETTAEELAEAIARSKAASAKPEPKCPACGSSSVLPLIWGMPDREAFKRIDRGELVSGGCMVWGDERDPAFECRACGERFGNYWGK